MIDTYKAMLNSYIQTVVPEDADMRDIMATKLAFLAGSYSVCRLIDMLMEKHNNVPDEEAGDALTDFREWLFNEVTLKVLRKKV